MGLYSRSVALDISEITRSEENNFLFLGIARHAKQDRTLKILDAITTDWFYLRERLKMKLCTSAAK